MHRLFQTHLANDWPTRMMHPDIWERVHQIDDGELWETHQVLNMRLIDFVRRRLVLQAERLGDHEKTQQVDRVLSPDILTIGSARRLAAYKRGDLILSDPERLTRLVTDPKRPIQIIFAGKAHPRDDYGKKILQRIIQFTKNPDLSRRIVFVEDYDYNLARHLVQGVDVWLNTPRRPMEACGTSGQKVVFNGGMNLSILDGWWNEAFNGRNGFAIGHGGMHADPTVQYRRDAEFLFDTLEKEVIPLYYERNDGGIPHRWIQMIKESMRSLGWRFNADRMVSDYVLRFYLPAAGGSSAQTD